MTITISTIMKVSAVTILYYSCNYKFNCLVGSLVTAFVRFMDLLVHIGPDWTGLTEALSCKLHFVFSVIIFVCMKIRLTQKQLNVINTKNI